MSVYQQEVLFPFLKGKKYYSYNLYISPWDIVMGFDWNEAWILQK